MFNTELYFSAAQETQSWSPFNQTAGIINPTKSWCHLDSVLVEQLSLAPSSCVRWACQNIDHKVRHVLANIGIIWGCPKKKKRLWDCYTELVSGPGFSSSLSQEGAWVIVLFLAAGCRWCRVGLATPNCTDPKQRVYHLAKCHTAMWYS